MAENEEVLLTSAEAYRATYHFIAQYYARQRITPFMLMLHSMAFDPGGEPHDPATWHDWMASVEAARNRSARLSVYQVRNTETISARPPTAATNRPIGLASFLIE